MAYYLIIGVDALIDRELHCGCARPDGERCEGNKMSTNERFNEKTEARRIKNAMALPIVVWIGMFLGFLLAKWIKHLFSN